MRIRKEHQTACGSRPCHAQRSDVNQLLQRSLVAYEGLAGQWRRALAASASDRLAIVHLWESGPLTMSELAERIPVSRPSMTALADRLEASGYIRRIPSRSDRRQIVLEVSELPFAILAPLLLAYTKDIEALTVSLDADQWRAIAGFLEALHRVSHEHADGLRAMTDVELARLVGTPATA